MTRTLMAKLSSRVRIRAFNPNCDTLLIRKNILHGTFLGDVLDVMEQRHDWARMTFTPELFKYVFTVLIPEVISHSQQQDEEQVRGHYDREYPIPLVPALVTKRLES